MNNQNKVGVPANLIIKHNQDPFPSDCPLCGVLTNPNIGAELFLENTESVVCQECGSKQAPVLASLLAFADLSRLFQNAEQVFGETWEKTLDFKRIPKNSFGIQTEAINGN